MSYVDGFLLAIPKDKVDKYREMSSLAGKVWMEYGALAYVETVADDVPYGELTSFPRAVQQKEDETVVFAWIVYPSREKRDEINGKVMKDERMDSDEWKDLFDGKRMIFGGFRPIVELP